MNTLVNEFKKNKTKFGTLQKCEIHLHTPASHDYKLTKGKTYKELEVEDILEICERELLFNRINFIIHYFKETQNHRILAT